MGLTTVELRIVPRTPQHSRQEQVRRAVKAARYFLDVRQDMLGAWGEFVSVLLRHPETAEHPVIWEGTHKITSGKYFSIEGLRELIERTAKAESEP